MLWVTNVSECYECYVEVVASVAAKTRIALVADVLFQRTSAAIECVG